MLYKSKLLTLKTIGHSWYVLQILLWVLFMGSSGRFTHVVIILDILHCLGQVYAGFVFG